MMREDTHHGIPLSLFLRTLTQAEEKASVGRNIEDFTKFLSFLVSEGMKGRPVAVI